jgi:hypothetical protein
MRTPGNGMDLWAGLSIEWTAHDFNNDGWIDILGGGALHYNNGDMAPSATMRQRARQPCPIGDLDNDGFLDMASGERLHPEQSATTNNWIRINPQWHHQQPRCHRRTCHGDQRAGHPDPRHPQRRRLLAHELHRRALRPGHRYGGGAGEHPVAQWDVETFQDLAINTTHTIVENTITAVAHPAPSTFAWPRIRRRM